MLNHYPDYITEAIQADIISETANGTYLGWFDRTHLDRSEGAAAIEAQPIWRIRFIEQTTTDGKSQVRTLYPYGNKSYEHVWNDRLSLNYQYAN